MKRSSLIRKRRCGKCHKNDYLWDGICDRCFDLTITDYPKSSKVVMIKVPRER